MPDESIQLPRNLDVERLMLGALLLSESPEQVLKARAGLPADAFMGQMREIYLTLCDMAERKDSINPVVLATRLGERGSKVEPATIAGLYDGVPRFSNSNLVSEIKILCDLATRRAILRHTENWFVEAQGRDVDVCALIGRIKSAAVDLGSVESKKGADVAPLSASWADFDAEEFTQGERIAFAVERGEIALLNALPNAGKTTLAFNVAVALAAGRDFPPVVTGRRERRVLYVDAETRRARLQRDLRTMTKGFSREEAMAVGQNLHIICEAEINGESLALTQTAHLLQLSADALRVKPDFIVIDTLSSLLILII